MGQDGAGGRGLFRIAARLFQFRVVAMHRQPGDAASPSHHLGSTTFWECDRTRAESHAALRGINWHNAPALRAAPRRG